MRPVDPALIITDPMTGQQISSDRMLIQFRSDVPEAKRRDVLRSLGLILIGAAGRLAFVSDSGAVGRSDAR